MPPIGKLSTILALRQLYPSTILPIRNSSLFSPVLLFWIILLKVHRHYFHPNFQSRCGRWIGCSNINATHCFFGIHWFLVQKISFKIQSQRAVGFEYCTLGQKMFLSMIETSTLPADINFSKKILLYFLQPCQGISILAKKSVCIFCNVAKEYQF